MGFWLAISAVFAGFAALFLGWRLAREFRVYHGTRVCECPADHTPAAVRVRAWHAAFTAVRGRPDLHVIACSRWPERENCNQACVAEIEHAPDQGRARAKIQHQ